MAKEIDFETGTVVTAAWLDNLQEVESALAFGLRITRSNAVVTVTPMADGTATGQASLRIAGLPRYNTIAVTVTVGGAAGIYSIYAVAGAGPGFTLAATTGAAPALSRKIAEADWNGTTITDVRPLVPSDPTGLMRPVAPSVSETPARAFGLTGQTAPLLELFATVNTATPLVAVSAAGVIEGRRSALGGLVTGRLTSDAAARFSLGLDGTMYWGGGTGALASDVTLYRDDVNGMYLSGPGGIYIDGKLTSNGNTKLGGTGSTLGFFGLAGTIKKNGYGAPIELTTIGSRAALTTASTLNDVLRHLSALENHLLGYGLIGA